MMDYASIFMISTLLIIAVITSVFAYIAQMEKNLNNWLNRHRHNQRHYCMTVIDWCRNNSKESRMKVQLRKNDLYITCYCINFHEAYSTRDLCRNQFYRDGKIGDADHLIHINFVGNHNNSLRGRLTLSVCMGDKYHD